MPAIPLPFVVALLIALLFWRVWQLDNEHLRPSRLFLGACLVLSIVVGLRWTFDLRLLRFLQPIIASCLPAITWLCFSGQTLRVPHRWLHLIAVAPITLMSTTWTLWQPPIDLALALLFFGYGAGLLRLAARGTDGFELVRLTDTPAAVRTTALAGVFLIVNGVVDLLVASDFAVARGNHAAGIIAVANLLTLPLLAFGIVAIGKGIPDAGSEDDISSQQPSEKASAHDKADGDVLAALDRLMREKRLYRDPDLTLSRLARRAVIPARRISEAVNRARATNVSQFVNDYRIAEAQRLLRETDAPVTDVMFEAGFQTKSNFNREFLRVTGLSPRAFRRAGTSDGVTERALEREMPAPDGR
jgi:AraC-like DNA-binding protein